MTTATVDTTAMDALDAAMNPEPASNNRTYFGQVLIVDARYFLKGGHGQMWDISHPIADRMNKVQIVIAPLKGQYDIKQDVFDFSKEWTRFTLPSLAALRLNLRTLVNAWVQVQRVETGETYQSKPKLDAQGSEIAPAETKAKTALKFIAAYPDRVACQAAADAFYSRFTSAAEAPAQAAPAAPVAPTVAPADDAARAQAATFLPMLWQMAAGDPSKFYKDLEANPVLSQYFDYDSPEVQAITGGVLF